MTTMLDLDRLSDEDWERQLLRRRAYERGAEIERVAALDRDLDELLRLTARERAATVDDIRGRARDARSVRDRWEFVRRAYLAGYSSTAVAAAIRRDHASVLHALRSMGVPRRPRGRPW